MNKQKLLEIIQNAAKTRQKKLNLSGQKIKELPPEIGQLTNLTELNLLANQITSLPPEIGQLTNLKELRLSNNQLASLPVEIWQLTNLTTLDLSNNQLSLLPAEIGRLKNLTSLFISNNQLASLPAEIGQLTNLTALHLSDNQLTSLPAEIGKLTNLISLWLHLNQLSSLPAEIEQLTNLMVLILLNNQLSSLPPEIGQLTNLRSLYLSDNKLSSLPSEIGQLTNLKQLYLHNNPALNLPPEILGPIWSDILQDKSKSVKPADILNFYFRRLKENTRPLNEVKVILVGQGKVGKTSLLKRLMNQPFDPNESQTHGIKIHRFPRTINGETINLNIWDFGGQEIMHATHQFFLTERTIYVLVLDSRVNRFTNKVDYWLRLIEGFAKQSPVIVVCNQCDQQHMDLDWTGLPKKFPLLKRFVKSVACCESPNGPLGIDDVWSAIDEEASRLDSVHIPYPVSYFTVKEKLEDLKQKNKIPYLTNTQYSDLCTNAGVIGDQEQARLLDILNSLGVMLYYGKHAVMRDVNVLNPEWITNGVYSIINNPDLLRARNGILDIGKLDRILDPAVYPKECHRFILDMMEKFELIFPMDGTRGSQYLIPDLLSEQQPFTGKWENVIRFEYEYDPLPDSIITRFIVRMHPSIYQGTYWRNGVVLKSREGRHPALIVSDQDLNKISILVETSSGSEKSAKRFLRDIRLQLEHINARPERKGITEIVPLPNDPTKGVSYDHLCLLEEKGIHDYLPDGAKEKIDVQELLNRIEEPEWREEKRRRLESIQISESLITQFAAPSHKKVDKEPLRTKAHQIITIIVGLIAIFGFITGIRSCRDIPQKKPSSPATNQPNPPPALSISSSSEDNEVNQ